MANKAELYNLPEAPEGCFWHVDDYLGNYDDGVYPVGSRVLIRLCRQSAFTWLHAFAVSGARRLIVTPDQATVRFAADSILNDLYRNSNIS